MPTFDSDMSRIERELDERERQRCTVAEWVKPQVEKLEQEIRVLEDFRSQSGNHRAPPCVWEWRFDVWLQDYEG